MKSATKFFIKTAVVVVFSVSSANASISNTLQLVCTATDQSALRAETDVLTLPASDRHIYRTKLAAHFNQSNCFGKQMIESGNDKLSDQFNLSESGNTLAIMPN